MTNEFQIKAYDNIGMSKFLCIDPNTPDLYILNTVNEQALGDKIAYMKVNFG